LTANGIAQAQIAHNFWQTEIDEQHIHAPDRYFVSPLFRTLQTAQVTFEGLRLPEEGAAAPFVPLIVEKLRENISIHTCDRRSNRTVIHEAYPNWRIEPGFTECDELWTGVTGETDSSEAERSIEVLDQIFAVADDDEKNHEDNGLFISITSHSGEIGSLLGVLGHRPFSLNTGAIIPVLVKAETIYHRQPTTTTTTTKPWTTSAHCTVPPVTSVSACVCPSSAMLVTTPLVPTGGCQ
jgi:broad specificity phosphatase PhoE